MSCKTTRKSHLALIQLVCLKNHWGEKRSWWPDIFTSVDGELHSSRQVHSAKTCLSSMWLGGFSLGTLVVFDGEIGIVQHLWDQSIVKVVPLDGVVFVHRTDSLDHLLSKEGETTCCQSDFFLFFAYSSFIVTLIKHKPYSYVDSSTIIVSPFIHLSVTCIC